MKMGLFIVILMFSVAVAFMLRPKQRLVVPPDAHAGNLALEKCTYKTKAATYESECGTLIVPENRLNPRSRLIAIPVKRIHAASASPLEPIVHLTGGPGMSNMRFNPPDELLANHDVLLVGYRGVDGSSVLDCPE